MLYFAVKLPLLCIVAVPLLFSQLALTFLFCCSVYAAVCAIYKFINTFSTARSLLI